MKNADSGSLRLKENLVVTVCKGRNVDWVVLVALWSVALHKALAALWSFALHKALFRF